MPPAVTEARAVLIADLFREWVGASPEGVWAAPGRVNLIGEHTDYTEGFVLPLAIDRDCTVAVRRHDGQGLRLRSLNVDEPAHELQLDQPVSGWPAYVVGTCLALRNAGVELPALDVLVSSDVPLGGGLSSSAALEGAVAAAVNEITQAELDRVALAKACQWAETDVVGAPVGLMDQLAALCGIEGHALLIDCRNVSLSPVPMPQGFRLLVIDTGTRHAHAGGEYAERRRACESAARELGVASLRYATPESVEQLADEGLRRSARHVVAENRRTQETAAALRNGDVMHVGALMWESHQSLREDFRVSCLELDTAVDGALRAGALGARMTGGGFGGCAVALVQDDAAMEIAVRDEVTQAAAVRQLPQPTVFAVRAAAGARRMG